MDLGQTDQGLSRHRLLRPKTRIQNNAHLIRRRHVVAVGRVGEGRFAVDLDGAAVLHAHGPLGQVKKMRSDVGLLAACVFVPPTESEVAAFLDVRHQRGLAEP